METEVNSLKDFVGALSQIWGILVIASVTLVLLIWVGWSERRAEKKKHDLLKKTLDNV